MGRRVISKRDPEWATETLSEEESEDQNVVYTYAHAFLWEGSSFHPVTALHSLVPRSLCSKCLRAGWLDEGREVGERVFQLLTWDPGGSLSFRDSVSPSVE